MGEIELKLRLISSLVVCPFVHLSVLLSVIFSVCLSVCLCIYLSVCLSDVCIGEARRAILWRGGWELLSFPTTLPLSCSHCLISAGQRHQHRHCPCHCCHHFVQNIAADIVNLALGAASVIKFCNWVSAAFKNIVIRATEEATLERRSIVEFRGWKAYL